MSSAEAAKDMEPEDDGPEDNNDKDTEPEDNNEIVDNNHKIAIENRGDKVIRLKNDEIPTEPDNNDIVNRHGRVSKQFDYKKYCPKLCF